MGGGGGGAGGGGAGVAAGLLGGAASAAWAERAIDGRIDQTKTIERVITALDLGSVSLEGSDSLDNPDAVFK